MFCWTSFYKNFMEKRRGNPNYDVNKLTEEEIYILAAADTAQQTSISRQKRMVAKMLNEQMRKLFEYVHSTGGLNPYPKPVYKQQLQATQFDKITEKIEKEMNRRKYRWEEIEVYNPGVELHHPDGFSLIIKKSNIDHPASGYGVFIRGEAPPGVIIGFYPGVIYYPPDITPDILQNNEYLMIRYDGVIIDARDWEQRAEQRMKAKLALKYAADLTLNPTLLLKFCNPFAIVNYINHPPKGTPPNVFCYPYDFPKRMPDELKAYVPHEYAENHSTFSELFWKNSNTFMESIVCVTRRFVKDEELFLNYRYNPFGYQYPDWYEQPDIEEAKRRWGPRRFWEILY